jgi:hypothetical protein
VLTKRSITWILGSSRNQSKTSSQDTMLNGSRSSSSRTLSLLGSCIVCAYPIPSATCADRSRLHILWESERYSPPRSQTWSGPDLSCLWIWEALSSTPAVLPSYPLDSLSSAILAWSFVLCSTDSLELFSNIHKIPFADPFLASKSTT